MPSRPPESQESVVRIDFVTQIAVRVPHFDGANG